MKIYLDTNIVLFFLFKQEELSIKVSNMLFDYSNILLTSTVCVDELIHLCQIEKIGNNKKSPFYPKGCCNTWRKLALI